MSMAPDKKTTLLVVGGSSSPPNLLKDLKDNLEQKMNVRFMKCGDRVDEGGILEFVDRHIRSRTSPARCDLVVLVESSPREPARNGNDRIGSLLEALEELRQHFDVTAPDAPLSFFIVPTSFISGDSHHTHTAMAAQEIERILSELQGTSGPLLLEGETGTGKTLLARLSHEANPRRTIFHEENCSALDPSESRMSTMFRGLAKPVYTGVKPAPSLFEDINGGTLFLDEFQEMRTRQQAMFLDLLDPFSTKVRGSRIGENMKRWEADVQVIVAINRPMRELLTKNRLREDIFHRFWRRARLSPLREILAVHENADKRKRFLRHKILRMQELGLRLDPNDVIEKKMACFAKAFGFFEANGRLEAFGGDSIARRMPIPDKLLEYQWPGNYREIQALSMSLGNELVIGNWQQEDVILFKFYRLTSDSTAFINNTPLASCDGKETPEKLIYRAWLQVLSTEGISRTTMANNLGLDVRTFNNRIKELSGSATGNRKSKDKFWFLKGQQAEDIDRLIRAAKYVLK